MTCKVEVKAGTVLKRKDGLEQIHTCHCEKNIILFGSLQVRVPGYKPFSFCDIGLKVIPFFTEFILLLSFLLVLRCYSLYLQFEAPCHSMKIHYYTNTSGCFLLSLIVNPSAYDRGVPKAPSLVFLAYASSSSFSPKVTKHTHKRLRRLSFLIG